MIRIIIREGRNGTYHAIYQVDHETLEASGQDPARDIARTLVEAGTTDQPWEIARGAIVAMRGDSLYRLAATAVHEGDKMFTRSWWSRHPNSPPRPVLERVVAEQKALAAERKKARAA